MKQTANERRAARAPQLRLREQRPARIAQELEAKVWPLIESGKIKPVVHAAFPLAEAAKAHSWMESGAHIGKIVLTVA